MSILKKFLFLLNSLLLLPQIAEAQELIPVERAIEIALSNNPGLRISRSEVMISESILRQTRAPLYPHLRGKMVIPFLERESGFYIDHILWDFGKTKARVKASEYHLESSKYSLANAKTALKRDTKVAYYRALSEKNRLAEAEILVERSEWILEKTEELFSVGKESRQQLSQAEINLQEAKLELASRENSYEISMLNLANIMNDDSLGRFEIKEDLHYEKLRETREQLIDLALSENFEVKSLLSNRVGIKASLTESKGKFLPSVFARAAYRFKGEDAQSPAVIAGLGIRIPIFEGFSRFGEMSQSKAELTRNEARTEELRNRIVLTVGELYLQLKHIERKIEILGESQSISKKNLKVVKQRYSRKSVSKIELAEAKALYEQSVSNYKNSIYDYKITRLKLLSLCGEKIQ